ncbi:MAG: branched-chain amino acid ABC transporter ATP-binding protein/permease [Desulfobacteria bacterium]
MKKAAALLADIRILLALAVVIGAAAGHVSLSALQLGSFLVINILLAQSINLLTGLAGQISLCHAAFFGIGAYGSAIFMRDLGLPLPATLAVGTLASAFFGYLLSFPSGRVREFYLAMMTLGFGMIFYEVAKEWTGLTGGVMGFSGIPSPELKNLDVFGFPLTSLWYFRLMLATLVAVLYLLRNFMQSHHGRAFYAVHVSEVAAGSMGISKAATKQWAYALSAAIAGLAGAFYAHLVGYLGPESFGLGKSVEALVMGVLGGLGSLAGPILGAVLLTYLPDRLQMFAEYQFMIYGAILMVSFLVMPKGLAGLLPGRTRYSKPPARAGKEELPPAPHRFAPSETPGGALLEVRDVSMNFSGLLALDGVSLSLPRNHVMALVGPNGSGKSTLVNVVSGVYRPTSGKVLLQETDITGWKDYAVARKGVIRTFQDPRNVSSFTVRENVLLGAHHLYRHGQVAAALNISSALREERAYLRKVDEVMEVTGLGTVADEIMRDLPYGYQRIAEVARAVVSDPDVILLDEPAAGLSDVELVRLDRLIRSLRARNIGIILIEHHMDFLSDLVDEVTVLDGGKVIYRGGMEGMRSDPAVVAAYLGMEEVPHA